MRLFIWLIAGLWICTLPLTGQQTYTVTGKVTDQEQHPLQGASVVLSPSKSGVSAGMNGVFELGNLPPGKQVLTVAYLGYMRYSDTLYLSEDIHLEIQLQPSFRKLQEVVITDDYIEKRMAEEPLGIEIVNDEYLRQNLGGSLMKSLERLPGVGTIDIGSGLSKPVIRGLSFNRVVVSENGIKHEGQQWGADHGLEIDQYANDRIEIIKGPSSLLYGSDAIGGHIALRQHGTPEKQSVGARIDLTGQSNNGLIGSSAYLFARGDKLYFTLRGTWMDYGDYRVPADSVDIYSFRLPLHKRSMRNTAGNEKNLHLSAGWINNGFSSRLFVSRIEGRSGFFANAHGLEPRNVDTELHDRSSRDIHDPYHDVSHWKVISRTAWRKALWDLEVDLGLQHNNRQEWSEYVSHGYMPSLFPDTLNFPPDLERGFDKRVYTGSLRGTFRFSESARLVTGISGEHQENRISGRGFIVPAFSQTTIGSFLYFRYELSDRSLFHAGVRYDAGSIHTDSYTDWFASEAVTGADTTRVFLQRSADLDRQFSNTTWSLGYNFNAGDLAVKANLGKAFRMPIAKELAANGVNYHRFSYEVGNADLSPEIAYQADAGVEWHNRRAAIGVTPFATYFPNYIYLNPGFEHDRLYGNGNQVFRYTQSRVARYGGELHAHYLVHELVQLGVIGEYIYSVQLSGEKRGYTLPFSPPATLLLNARYARDKVAIVRYPYLSVDLKKGFAQNRIVPPEERTPGYLVVNVALGGKVALKRQAVEVSLQIRNLLNSKYFSHTSYYRLINVPEPGRNFIVNIAIPFSARVEKR